MYYKTHSDIFLSQLYSISSYILYIAKTKSSTSMFIKDRSVILQFIQQEKPL